MRWVEGDTVKLSANHGEAHDQARKALEERFPNAWKWFVGYSRPGMLTGEQITAIIEKGEKPPEVEPWEFDEDQVREMVRFLCSNWCEAGRVHYFSYEDWECIYQALRYAAKNIDYLPKSEREEKLREYSRVLSARIIAEGYIRPCETDDLDMGDPPLYPHDWVTIFHACQYAWKNMPTDNPTMAKFREKLEGVVPELLNRVKYHHLAEFHRNGIKDIHIARRLEEVVVEPWNLREDIQKDLARYRELRKLQGDPDWETADGGLCVLMFRPKPGAVVKGYDRLGNLQATDVIPEDSTAEFRDWDVEVGFASGTVVLGKGYRENRWVIAVEDVEVYEGNISRGRTQSGAENLEYIYANFTVHKRDPKKKD